MTTYDFPSSLLTPSGSNNDPNAGLSLGQKFTVSTTGLTITGVRWWNTHTDAALQLQVGIYDAAGTTLLASSTLTSYNVTINTWTTINLTTPYAVTSGTSYYVMVYQVGVVPGKGVWYSAMTPPWPKSTTQFAIAANGGQYNYTTSMGVATGGAGNFGTSTAWFGVDIEATGSGGGTDYTGTPSDPVGITDAASDNIDAVRAPADPVGVTDSVTASFGPQAFPADPVGVTDSATGTISSAGTYTATPSDPVGVTDAVLAQLGRVVTVADLLNLTDSAQPARALVTSPADPVGVTDAAAWTAGFAESLGESAGVTDVITVSLSRMVAVTDVIGITDDTDTQTNLVNRDVLLLAEPFASRWSVSAHRARWITTPEEDTL